MINANNSTKIMNKKEIKKSKKIISTALKRDKDTKQGQKRMDY